MSMIDLRKIESRWQKHWEKEKLFETEPDKRQKFYMLFAYPTVSGTLHIGHARSYTIPDVIARYKRMRGFNVFFPLGFHATGIDSLKILEKIRKDPETAKTYGIPESEAKKFKNVSDVVKYLEKNMVDSFKKLGLSLDYRPAVSTIDEQYKRFVNWQFIQLKKLKYLIQDEHRLAWCPHDNHPVSLDPAEADIMEWKGAQIKDYIIIKFKVGSKVLPAATLRPETIFGVTNIWLNPKAHYVEATIGSEKWIVSKEALKKLTDLEKDIKFMEKFDVKELFNKHAVNPANQKQIPILPGSFVNSDEATGVVMSVPAHDPFDYMYLQKYDHLKPIKVIDIPGFETFPAKEILEKSNITDPKDPRIEKAVKELYKIEYMGKMISSIPQFGGMPVAKAKSEIADWLKKNNFSDMIYELSVKPIHCRCGNEIIIKSVKNQWFIDYGNDNWKGRTWKHVEKMNIYPEEYKKELPSIVDWLEARPCIRKRGIGTEFPFEKGWVIEALSDSTIYMSFFIVSKYFNAKKIDLKDLTLEFFDYVFLGKGKPEKKVWEEIRKEFLYWYPLDLNAAGKEHKSAHFPLFIFNHVGIFPQNLWPKGIFVNWHLINDGKKMSKHIGNVVYWNDPVQKYGADIVRFYLTHGANQWEDFDWKNVEVEAYSKHLTNFYNLVSSFKKSEREERKHIDEWFESRINRIIELVTNYMEKYEIRKALDVAFFSVMNDIYWYNRRAKKVNVDIIPTWIKILSPFVPHVSEEIWGSLGNKESVVGEEWPVYDSSKIHMKAEALEEEIKNILSDTEQIKKLSKIQKPAKITIFTSPAWKYEIYNAVLEGKQLKDILEDAKLKKIGKEVSDYYNRLQKRKPLDELFLTAAYEFDTLKKDVEFFEREFDCKVEVISAEHSTHPKAKVADPGKSGILIE